jgi:hypothetical protein
LKWSFLLDGFHPGSYVPEDLAVEVIGAHVLALGGVVFGVGLLNLFWDVPFFVEIGAVGAALLVGLRGFYEVHRYRSDGFLWLVAENSTDSFGDLLYYS